MTKRCTHPDHAGLNPLSLALLAARNNPKMVINRGVNNARLSFIEILVSAPLLLRIYHFLVVMYLVVRKNHLFQEKIMQNIENETTTT